MRASRSSKAGAIALCLLALFLLVPVGTEAAAQSRSADSDQHATTEMRAVLRRSGSVRLSVRFVDRNSMHRSLSGSYNEAVLGAAQPTPPLASHRGVRTLSVLGASPGVEMVVTDEAVLDILATDPAISSIVIPPFQADLGRQSHVEQTQSLDADEVLRGEQRATSIEAGQMHGRGFAGAGIRVAVLDTGVDASHPDLAHSVEYERCLQVFALSSCPNGLGEQGGSGAAAPTDGHGTGVASLIASAGTLTPIGVAPEAGIEAIRISNGVDLNLQDALLALDHVLVERDHVQVVLMAFGSRARFPGACDRTVWPSFFDTVSALRARGVVMVAAAGNDSAAAERFPACLDDVLSVAALDIAGDDLAPISNASPVTDLAAAGSGAVVHDQSSMATGTSVASALVAGCVALALDSGQAGSETALEWMTSPTTTVAGRSGGTIATLQCAPHCFGRPATVNIALDQTPTAAGDVVIGSNGNDVISAGPGDDLVCAGPGDDLVLGGQGRDRIDGHDGSDRLWGNFDDDEVRGGSGPDTLHGNHGADVLVGEGGDDRLYGYTGDDVLSGGRGDDRLHGNRGEDDLSGDAGDDLVFGYTGADQVDGGIGLDRCAGNDGADSLLRCEVWLG